MGLALERTLTIKSLEEEKKQVAFQSLEINLRKDEAWFGHKEEELKRTKAVSRPMSQKITKNKQKNTRSQKHSISVSEATQDVLGRIVDYPSISNRFV